MRQNLAVVYDLFFVEILSYVLYNIEDRKELAFINLQGEGMKDKILELEKRFFKKGF